MITSTISAQSQSRLPKNPEPAELLTEARGVFVEPPLSHDLVEELTPGDKLKDDEDLGPRGKNLNKRHDVVVLHHLHDGYFLLDLCAHVLLLNLLLVEDLDRDVLLGLAVDGVLYLSEGSLAEGLADLILSYLFHHGAGILNHLLSN